MSDLISRNDLTNKIRGIVPGSQDVDFIVRLIDEQPTAYDVEKVVEEIKISSGNGYRDVDGDYVPPMIKTKNAIDIVRKGGIDG